MSYFITLYEARNLHSGQSKIIHTHYNFKITVVKFDHMINLYLTENLSWELLIRVMT